VRGCRIPVGHGGTDFVQRKGFDAAPFIAGLSYALLVTNLLYINQFPGSQGRHRGGQAALGRAAGS